jgi:hypothetical protein
VYVYGILGVRLQDERCIFTGSKVFVYRMYYNYSGFIDRIYNINLEGLAIIFLLSHILSMEYMVNLTETCEKWLLDLTEKEQIDVLVVIRLLEKLGPNLGYPYSSKINGSRHSHMRELRIQHKGKPYRVLYAFDPQRAAILLIGGTKVGDDRWYKKNMPIADKLYDEHLRNLEEGRGHD